MKKYFISILFILTSLIMVGQNETMQAELGYNETFKTYPGKAGDTIGSLDSVWTYNIQKLSVGTSRLYVYTELDSISGTSDTVFVYTLKKMFEDEAFSPWDTIIYHMSADTTFSYITRETDADQWQFKLQGQTDEVKILLKQLNFKFLK